MCRRIPALTQHSTLNTSACPGLEVFMEIRYYQKGFLFYGRVRELAHFLEEAAQNNMKLKDYLLQNE